MAFEETIPRNDYIGTGGLAEYDYDFKIFAATDLRVTTRTSAGVETALIYTTDYTVAGVGSPNGGSITLVAGNLASGATLTIRWDRTPKQSTDLRNQGALRLTTLEDKFDEIVRYIQANRDVLSRTLHLPETEVGSDELTELPTYEQRLSKFLFCDSTGRVTGVSVVTAGALSVSAFSQTLLDDASDAAARATLKIVGPGTVLLAGDGSGTWLCYAPDGTAISIAGSTTDGLQEAITYAFANNRPLVVTGGGTITCTTAISIPAGFNDSLYIESGITIAFGTLGAANLIAIDSQENCEIRIKAIITQTAGNTGAVISIRPQNAAPTTGNITCAASVFEFGDCVPASGGVGLLLDPTVGGIIGNKIFIADINGGTDGIKVANPGSGVIAFQENHIEWAYIHGQSGRCVRVCTSTTNATTVRRNLWICGRLAPNGASSIGIDTYENISTFLHITASNEEGTLNKGLVFESGANNNNVLGCTITGATTITIDNSGAGNIVIASGIAVPMGGSSSSISVVGKATAQLTQVATIANTSETTLQTYSFPANAFNATGQSVRAKAWGSFAANANNKTVKLYFGSSSFVNSGAVAGNNVKWVIEGTVHRTGSSTQKSNGHFVHGVSEVGIQNNSLTETDTAAITIKVTGQNGTASASDIVCEGMVVDFGA